MATRSPARLPGALLRFRAIALGVSSLSFTGLPGALLRFRETALWVSPLSFTGPATRVPRGEGALSQRRGYRVWKGQRAWLELGPGDVRLLSQGEVLEWASAVLKAGNLDDSGVAEAVAVIQTESINGVVITAMSKEKLGTVIGYGPAFLLKSQLGRGVADAVAAQAPAERFNLMTEEGKRGLVAVLSKRFGLRKNRFKVPARLTSGGFHFAQTQEREAAFASLFRTWAKNYGMIGREKFPLPALPGAPGTGKTRFSWLCAARGCLPGEAEVDEEWQKAMDNLEDSAFKTGILNAVGLTVTFSMASVPGEGEKHQFMIGVRMLYGHFFDSAVPFLSFLGLLRRLGCHEITPEEALGVIEWDITANYVALDNNAKRHVILVVDETLGALTRDATAEQRKVELGFLTTSVGLLITEFPHVHVLMTTLSGSDLIDSSWTVSRRGVAFIEGFYLLSSAAVDVFVAAEPPHKQARLRQPKFKAVLSECAGVPRLIEKVFLAADSQRINDDSSCEAIRLEVGRLFESHYKYENRQFRSDALLAALSPWRLASDERRQKTRAAERAGYLFDGKIPPLLLLWWSSMENERGMVDETHALLQAAVGIYTLSNAVCGAEHGLRFERQLAHLWRILTITDAVSRREGGERRPRTINSLLGMTELPFDAVSEEAEDEANASFNIVLKEIGPKRLLRPFEELDKPAGCPTDVPEHLRPGIPYFPKDNQNPGFDFALEEPAADDRGGVLVLVEAKFSAEAESTAPLSQAAIVDKYVKAIRDRPTVCERLLAGRLCYVIGGLRKVRGSVMKNVDTTVNAIVDELRRSKVVNCGRARLVQLVRGSLVLLTRPHTKALLTQTLSSFPPFGEGW